MSTKIALVGAGSSAFGRSIVNHFTASEALKDDGLDIALMDVKAENLEPIHARTEELYSERGLRGQVTMTTNLDEALSGAHAVVTAIEVDRLFYWSQDFHIPRKYGFHQVFGENGEIGGIFHALRNIPPMIAIARAIERLCPEAVLLNFSNPEHKLCEAINRLTSVNCFGLCPGVFMGRYQIAHLLKMEPDDLETQACGMNHFTWFTKIQDRRTGEDLYPRLRSLELDASPLFLWNEVGLGRILLRRYGLWPSPGANHYVEYLGWAKEFVAENLQYFYDPAEEDPWNGGRIPAFIYTINWAQTSERGRDAKTMTLDDNLVEEVEGTAVGLGVSILEGRRFGLDREVAAANVPNLGAVANLPDDMIVEIPLTMRNGKAERDDCGSLPEGIAGVIRNHGTIHKLIVEAYVEKSKEKLLHAILLEPIVDSYSRAVQMMDELLERQKGLLPDLR
jgi:alpha-galactosidase/6-phospho-beta-glucosidase family protein